MAQEPEKETAPAASVKKQPPVQEKAAAVQPVKAAAVEVSGATRQEATNMICEGVSFLNYATILSWPVALQPLFYILNVLFAIS